MRRAFQLQMHGRRSVHGHTCELCGEVVVCADESCDVSEHAVHHPENLYVSTRTTCRRCQTPDCPACKTLMRLEWQCDTVLAGETMDNGEPRRKADYSAECPRCGVLGRFVDMGDGNGPMLAEWTSGPQDGAADDVVLTGSIDKARLVEMLVQVDGVSAAALDIGMTDVELEIAASALTDVEPDE